MAGSRPRPYSCRKVQERAHLSGTVLRAPAASWLLMGWPQVTSVWRFHPTWLPPYDLCPLFPPLPSARLEDGPESE